jgi:hypothetical protein
MTCMLESKGLALARGLRRSRSSLASARSKVNAHVRGREDELMHGGSAKL